VSSHDGASPVTKIQRTALLPYPAERLFELVSDIESYPDYMEGCVGAQVLRRDADLVDARLELARGGIEQSFATRNRSLAPHTIELELLEGPFKKFSGRWHFQTLGSLACKVSLDLEFTLNNRLLGVAAGKLFAGVTGNLVDAVARRAHDVLE
jgi:ribosome-associated toxin RatA of RatAB toxin-antitoxin module